MTEVQEQKMVRVEADAFCAYHPHGGLDPARGCSDIEDDVKWKLGSAAMLDGWIVVPVEIIARVPKP